MKFLDRMLINLLDCILLKYIINGGHMKGLILNEGGYVTYPFQVFERIEPFIRKLNWRVSNVICCGDDTFKFPFEDNDECFIDGDSLYDMLKNHPDLQWIWGILSGFPKEIPYAEIKNNPIIDVTEEQPYLKGELHHIESKAVLELVAFDSTETYVLADDEELVATLKNEFPNADNLEKYVF